MKVNCLKIKGNRSWELEYDEISEEKFINVYQKVNTEFISHFLSLSKKQKRLNRFL